jgi:hypothetical protein
VGGPFSQDPDGWGGGGSVGRLRRLRHRQDVGGSLSECSLLILIAHDLHLPAISPPLSSHDLLHRLHRVENCSAIPF